MFVLAVADTILAYFYVLGILQVYILFNTLTSTLEFLSLGISSTPKLIGGGGGDKEGKRGRAT